MVFLFGELKMLFVESVTTLKSSVRLEGGTSGDMLSSNFP